MAMNMTVYMDDLTSSTSVTLPGAKEPLNLTFYPYKVSVTALAEAEKAAAAGQDLAVVLGMIECLIDALESWDATIDEDGTPLPLNAQVLGKLSPQAISAIFEAVITAVPKD